MTQQGNLYFMCLSVNGMVYSNMVALLLFIYEYFMCAYKRFIRLTLEDELFYNSALYLSGPKNVGKKSLCRECDIKYSFVDFKDKNLAKIANNNPSQFVKSLPSGIKLIQYSNLVPNIYRFVKRVIHRIAKRCLYDVPPQFLILDEAHPVLETKQRFDAINAASVIELYPLSASEAFTDGNIQFIHNIYNALFEKKTLESSKTLLEASLSATFPGLVRESYSNRKKYYEDFLKYVLDKLARKRFNLERNNNFRNFLKYLSNKVGQKLDWQDISKHLSSKEEYCIQDLEVLRQLYLILTVPAWGGNKKEINNHIIFLIDSGLLFYILGRNKIDDEKSIELLLEQFVATEMIKHIACFKEYEFYHLKAEKDLGLEFLIKDVRDEKIIGIKLVARNKIEESDFKDLKKFKEFAAEKFGSAIIVYLGNEIIHKGKDFFALPVQTIWGEE